MTLCNIFSREFCYFALNWHCNYYRSLSCIVAGDAFLMLSSNYWRPDRGWKGANILMLHHKQNLKNKRFRALRGQWPHLAFPPLNNQIFSQVCFLSKNTFIYVLKFHLQTVFFSFSFCMQFQLIFIGQKTPLNWFFQRLIRTESWETLQNQIWGWLATPPGRTKLEAKCQTAGQPIGRGNGKDCNEITRRKIE